MVEFLVSLKPFTLSERFFSEQFLNRHNRIFFIVILIPIMVIYELKLNSQFLQA